MMSAIKTNQSLKPYNTFGVEASARYFAEVHTVEALKTLLQNPELKPLPKLFLGGGSNLLLTQDFKGLVVALQMKGITETLVNDDEVLVTAQAGENWHQFVCYNIERNYGGLENLSLIPGNVGTSPIQNIGAYGVEIKDYFESCEVLNLATLEVETWDRTKCRFGYRDSIFKQEAKGLYIILSVTFRLTRQHHRIRTDYGAIQAELHKMGVTEPTISAVSQAVIAIRTSKLPNPKEIGNAGSFFKNPTISTEQYAKLKQEYPEIPGYEGSQGVKVPAGWLIEKAGWKGKSIGEVATHQHQALVIINATGKASGQEIFDFSTQIIQTVQRQFGITLEREVNVI